MKEIELEDYQIEDIEFLLQDIENTFNIHFEDGELKVENLKNLDQIVLDKIQKEDDNLCTSQKVFYKLRNIFDKLDLCKTNKLKTNTPLKDIIPQKNRRKLAKQIDEILGFKTYILRPSYYVLGFGFILFFVSIFICCFSGTVGLVSMGTSLLIIYLSCQFSRNLNFDTIRELAQNITEKNYQLIRKDTNTINKNEVKTLVNKWLSKVVGHDIRNDVDIIFSIKME